MVAVGGGGSAVGVSASACVGCVVATAEVGATVAVLSGVSTGSSVGASAVGAGSAVGTGVEDGGTGVSARATTGAEVAVGAGASVEVGACGAGCSAGVLPPQARKTVRESVSAAPIIACLNFGSIIILIPPSGACSSRVWSRLVTFLYWIM